MVFKKPNRTGSVLHDTLAMENGDNTITCSALDIDGNRVPTSDKLGYESGFIRRGRTDEEVFFENDSNRPKGIYKEVDGRYPSQTFVDSQVAEKLDLQSGISKSSKLEPHHKTTTAGWGNGETLTQTNKFYGGDIGGCSKMHH